MNNNYDYEDLTATVNVNRAPVNSGNNSGFMAGDDTMRVRQTPNCQPRPNQDYDYIRQSQPAQPYGNPPTKQGKKKKTASKFLTALLSILLFFTSAFSVVIYDARNAMKEDSLEKLLENVAFTELLVDCGAVTEEDLDEFYNDVWLIYGVRMSGESLDSFIDNSDIKQFFASRLADFCSDFFDGKSPELVLTKRDVVKLFTDNTEAFRDEFGLYATIGMMGELVDYMLEGKSRIVVLSTEDLQEDFPLGCSLVRSALSYTTMVLLIALSVVIILIMMLRSFSHGACGTGIVFVILGLLKLVITFIVPSLLGDSSIATLLSNFMMLNIALSVILLVLGMVLLIIKVVLKYRSE